MRTLNRITKPFILGLLLALVVSACQLPEAFDVPESPLLRFIERKSGLIAYVGVDGNIYTMNQAGGNVVAITDDAQLATGNVSLERIYQHPTWAPDSESLAFFGLETDAQGSQKASIFSTSLGSDPVATELFASNTEIPFYSYWAPDSQKLGFLSTSQTSNTMVFNLVDRENEHQILDAARPYYWNWAPDSSRLIIHAGTSAEGSSVERLAFLDIASDGQVLESVMEPQLSFFQAPAWSPSGEWLLFATEEDGVLSLVLADHLGIVDRVLLNFDEAIAFGFSPDGKKVAAIVGSISSNGLIGGNLHVFELANPEEAYITEENNVISFFWAPNSNDIAYFPLQIVEPGQEGNPDQQPLAVVSIQAYAHNQRTTREIVGPFVPTPEFANILVFFNQYQHSATIWSPDSQYIVFPIQTQEAPIILVISSSGSFEPRPLANGVLAFWSWD